ncbi:acyl-CoA dehydrogenase/oxidase C-terminal [Pilaira anomala]|nr:acyl-CoA dehydrogenase/oxidase C-terminal [Pilaira anomala]
MPVIKSQGTEKQIEKWYNPARKCLIIGCYAQTELSHGSNVMALKTSAVYDKNLDQFIIHTPDITAAKWWIGGLGIACTHAVVQAQLIIGDKLYGPHLFIVPIRSPIDLKPLKGITVGDIGPKAYGGTSGNDNGYVIFDQVRVPRENMLMRFSKVTRDGDYISPVHSKMAYGSMVKIRVDLITEAGWKLAKAVTIATRYCTVRRQFYTPADLTNSNKNDRLELQVISYSSVQHRLMPLIATAFALIISGEDMYVKLNQMTSLLAENNAKMLPEVHASSCALKTWGTRRSTDGIEESRKSMGGHGYSIFSGISELFATFVPSNTYEGENYVLCQQVARFLLKQLGAAKQGKGVTSVTAEYLNILADKTATKSFMFGKGLISEQILDPKVQLHIFGMRAARLVTSLQIQLDSGRPWSDLNMECWAVNLAHAEYLIMKSMIQKVNIMRSSPNYTGLVDTMKIISDLFCLSNIVSTSLATFLSTSTIDTSDIELLNEQYRIAISKVANIAIPLTDSFGFTDYELNTALGKKDGRAYEHLWEAVQNNPVNMNEENTKLSKLVLDILHRENGLKEVKKSKL